MNYPPNSIKPVEMIAKERGFHVHHALDGFGKAEYEWIATRMLEESQKAGSWVYITPFGFPFNDKSQCLSYMTAMHSDGWLDKEGRGKYRLNTHAIERIAQSFSR